MRYILRPSGSSTSGGFAVTASNSREALAHIREMQERGVTVIDIVDREGKAYGPAEIERLALQEGEADGAASAPAG